MGSSALMGAPFYSLADYQGMGGGPAALRSRGIARAMGSPADSGDALVSQLTSDLAGPEGKNFQHFVRSTESIRKKALSIYGDSYFVLGGECSVVVGTLAGISSQVVGNPGLLWMDAHGDFNTPESSPSGYIGGMCLAMACGKGPSISEEVDLLRPLVSEERLVHVGSRALDPPEAAAFGSSPAMVITAQSVKKTGAVSAARESARRLGEKADWIFFHLDVDVIDPTWVPAVNYPEPGGLTPQEVAEFVRAVRRTGKMMVFELTSYNSAKDHVNSSADVIVDLVDSAFKEEA